MKILIAVLLLQACVADTGGARVTFDAQVAATAPVTAGSIVYDDADTGWHVTLTTAKVYVGPLYLWSQLPLDQADRGFLRGEVVEQTAVDLIVHSTTPLASGDGLAGQALSGEIWLAPPPTEGYTFEVAGSATKNNGVPVTFHGGLTIDDSVVDEESGDTAFAKRRVRAIPIEANIADGGTLTINCDARKLLAGAVFEDLAASGEIAYPDPIWNQWFYDVRQSRIGPWSLAWSQP